MIKSLHGVIHRCNAECHGTESDQREPVSVLPGVRHCCRATDTHHFPFTSTGRTLCSSGFVLPVLPLCCSASIASVFVQPVLPWCLFYQYCLGVALPVLPQFLFYQYCLCVCSTSIAVVFVLPVLPLCSTSIAILFGLPILPLCCSTIIALVFALPVLPLCLFYKYCLGFCSTSIAYVLVLPELPNQHSRELIGIQKTSHKHNNKDLNHHPYSHMVCK